MNTLKRCLYTLAVAAVCVSTGAAQIRDYRGSLDPKRGYQITRIAVEDFVGREGSLLLSSDSVMLIRLAETVRADLGFSPFYETIQADSFYMRHMELKAMTILGWSQLGAQYVVTGKGEVEKDQVALSYELYSTTSGVVFARGRFTSPAKHYRHLAHVIANDIIQYLTGDKGIFDTKICFISTRKGNKEVYLCDYDGANIYQLTGNGSINLSPSFAPDGLKILFTSFMHDDPQLYEYDIGDGSVEQLAGYPGINSAARVSPDGESIACTLSRDGNPEIYLLYRSGKINRRLTYSPSIESSPCWSPNGREIAFTSDRTGTAQIYVMDREGANLRRLSYVGNYNDSPAWSPRGDRIAFISRTDGGFNICTVDVTGDNLRTLTNLGNNESPQWSPDGNHIVFSSTRTGEKEIYVMDMFGNEQRRLTTGGGNSNPDWSDYVQ